MSRLSRAFWGAFLLPMGLAAQEVHDHGAPEKLGAVSFPISCQPSVQAGFNRAVALLHSFAYSLAERAFRQVGENDPHCAMAHWGIAIAQFHQLWDPPLSPSAVAVGQEEIQRARGLGTGSDRERRFIAALALIYQTDSGSAYRTRALQYER
ncbi:MAG: hypothetical protein ACJ74Y_00815, partial [Bryobacteraceae bacterium]